jgi:hypothetical protein
MLSRSASIRSVQRDLVAVAVRELENSLSMGRRGTTRSPLPSSGRATASNRASTVRSPHVCLPQFRPGARSACESTLFERLEASGVAPEMVAINSAGCFFTVDERDAARVRAAVASLNVPLRLRTARARVSLTRGEAAVAVAG